ncbi:hypothetical protein LSAT2_028614 [Lamellibrachia satsuma]|nr:hypothetical protein LSAT2_028614 [Lamellibrachia satsuma]
MPPLTSPVTPTPHPNVQRATSEAESRSTHLGKNDNGDRQTGSQATATFCLTATDRDRLNAVRRQPAKRQEARATGDLRPSVSSARAKSKSPGVSVHD